MILLLYTEALVCFSPVTSKPKSTSFLSSYQNSKMRSQSLFFSGVLLFFAYSASPFRAVNGDGVTEECSGDFQKVMGCLSYATGKANTPTKDCCSSVQDIKESDPKCLCFIMQKTNNGSAQIKSLGIQEAKLLQLPTACKLQNASLSFCPSEYPSLPAIDFMISKFCFAGIIYLRLP